MCAEQYMMHGKAIVFGDREIAEQILAATQPRAQKALGRKVRNFDDVIWKKNRESIVLAGNRLKFTQNEHLKTALVATRGRAGSNDHQYVVLTDRERGTSASDGPRRHPSR